MNIEMLLAFSIGMTILAATPGVGVFASVSTALAQGFNKSLFLIGGLVLGDIIFFLLALAGLSAISTLMGELFFFIKIAGGIYLIYLGIKMYRQNSNALEEVKVEKKSSLKIFTSGFLVTMGNPKPILFYASVVPTIIDVPSVTLMDVFILAGVITFISFAVIGTYCYLAAASKKLVKNTSVARKLNKAAGLVLCGTGGYIIVK